MYIKLQLENRILLKTKPHIYIEIKQVNFIRGPIVKYIKNNLHNFINWFTLVIFLLQMKKL